MSLGFWFWVLVVGGILGGITWVGISADTRDFWNIPSLLYEKKKRKKKIEEEERKKSKKPGKKTELSQT